MKRLFNNITDFFSVSMWVFAALLWGIVALTKLGLIAKCGLIFDVASVFGILSIGTMLVVVYVIKGSAAVAWYKGLERSVEAPIKIVRAIRRAHRGTFGRLRERGAISVNLQPHPQKTNNRASGRQSGAKTDKKQSSGSKSSDDDGGGDGEPPRQLYSYQTLAQILDCSDKTLRNKVSAGKIPHPIPTIIGPRFTHQQILDLTAPVQKPEQKQQKRPRGRPRIALLGRGGAA